MRKFFMNFSECSRCAGCAHYRPLTSQRKHSPRTCHYVLDVGHSRGEPVQSCTKKTAVIVVTA